MEGEGGWIMMKQERENKKVCIEEERDRLVFVMLAHP